MKEYEIVAKMYNACAGSGRPQIIYRYDNGSITYVYEFTEL